MQRDNVLLSSAYLPPLHYFCKIFHYKNVLVEQHCNYVKQTYRNRCNIAAGNGLMPLSIPVERSGVKCLTRDVRISDHDNWRKLHWQAIVSAYNNTPFFEYYRDDFEPFYTRRIDFLFDFNQQQLQLLLQLLDIETEVGFTSVYQKETDETVADFREKIHPKIDFSSDTDFTPVPYYQVFQAQNGFIPNLSIIDLLFNCGPESVLILRDSHKPVI